MTAAPLQNLDDLEAALIRCGEDAEIHTEVLERIRNYLDTYARLETLLLGGVEFPVPDHVLEESLSDPASSSLERAERLADRERDRLSLGDNETGEVMRLLDREGLKVYCPRFPESSGVEGVFLFDQTVGPVLTVNAALSPVDADFLFARLYAHYLMDNDPYEIHIVTARPESQTDMDLRAQAFAASFLVPREGLDAYLHALEWRAGDPLGSDTLVQLALFFEVGYRTLLSRLLRLEHLRADQVPGLMDSLPPPPDISREPSRAIPERFVRFALEAHARGGLNMEELASVLETDLGSAERLTARFRLEDDPVEPPPGPVREGEDG